MCADLELWQAGARWSFTVCPQRPHLVLSLHHPIIRVATKGVGSVQQQGSRTRSIGLKAYPCGAAHAWFQPQSVHRMGACGTNAVCVIVATVSFPAHPSATARRPSHCALSTTGVASGPCAGTRTSTPTRPTSTRRLVRPNAWRASGGWDCSPWRRATARMSLRCHTRCAWRRSPTARLVGGCDMGERECAEGGNIERSVGRARSEAATIDSAAELAGSAHATPSKQQRTRHAGARQLPSSESRRSASPMFSSCDCLCTPAFCGKARKEEALGGQGKWRGKLDERIVNHNLQGRQRLPIGASNATTSVDHTIRGK